MFLLIQMLAVLTILYVFCILLLLAGSCRLEGSGIVPELPAVSVVVAARNEEKGIGDCLEALAAQEYPVGRLQVIIVNDRSEDRTGEIIGSFCARLPHFEAVTVTDTVPDMPAKKRALTLGIARSTGEIILTTDADCIPGPRWAAAMAGSFDERTGMVAGYSVLSGARGLVPRFASLHAYAMELVNAGFIGLGSALSCTGRNLAYRKEVFGEVGGFEPVKHSVSGDDDLLLHLVRTRTTWSVRYCTDPAARVTSFPPADARTFARQQTRHISASRFYPRPFLVLGAAVYLYFLLIAVSLAAAVAGVLPWWPVWTALVIKMAAESLAMIRAARLFGPPEHPWLFPAGSLLFIIHILVFSVTGLGGKFSWK